ncbi:MAG: hypothetical protein ABWY93_22720 [Mycobacterium sp.]
MLFRRHKYSGQHTPAAARRRRGQRPADQQDTEDRFAALDELLAHPELVLEDARTTREN